MITGAFCKHRAAGSLCSVLFIFGLGSMGCGGGVKNQADLCEKSFQQLASKNDEEVCSPILYNHFEGQVTEWRSQCGDEAGVHKKKLVANKLSNAWECSEEVRREETLSASCSGRLSQVSNAPLCLGEECAPLLDELKLIEEECSVTVLKGKFAMEIATLNQQFEERIHEENRLLSLRELIMKCDGFADIKGPKQAHSALGGIINAVTRTKKFDEPTKPGSEIERFTQGALDSCGFALTAAMEMLTQFSPEEKEKILSVPKRRKRYVKRYKRMGERLEKINAAALFPDAMAMLSNLLIEFGVSKEEATFHAKAPVKKVKEASEEVSKKAPKETEVHEVASIQADAKEQSEVAETSMEEDPALEKKCKELNEKRMHFEAKADAYEKKGNKNKTEAYQAKAEKICKKMEETGCPSVSSVG